MEIFVEKHSFRRVPDNSPETLSKLSDCNCTWTQKHLVRKQTLIRPVWPNGWVFVYKLSGSGFESSCSHFAFRFRACFEQGVPWYSGNYRVWFTLKGVRDMTRAYSLSKYFSPENKMKFQYFTRCQFTLHMCRCFRD